MNLAEIKVAMEVMSAFTEGKVIQNRRRGTKEWNDLHLTTDTPNFTFSEFEYRIKPMPEEFFITVYGDDARAAMSCGSAHGFEQRGVGGTYVTAAEARRSGVGGHRIFKVTEEVIA